MKVSFILQAKLCSRPCSASTRGKGPHPSSRVRSSPSNIAKATGDKLDQRSTKKSWAKAGRPDAPVSMKMIPLEVVHARGPPYIFFHFPGAPFASCAEKPENRHLPPGRVSKSPRHHQLRGNLSRIRVTDRGDREKH